MGIFSRSPSDPVEPARRHLKSTTAVLADATKNNSKAQAALTEAIARRDASQARLDAARDAYRGDPTDANVKGIRDAKEDLELAELQLDRPRATAQDADIARLTAQRAVAEAEAEVTRQEREVAISELRARASVECFRAATNEPTARILAAYSEIQNFAEQIESQWKKSVAAAEALIQMGVENPPVALSRQHLLSGVALAKAVCDASGISAQIVLDTDCGAANPVRVTDVRGLKEVLRIHALDAFDGPKVLRHHAPDALAKIQRILAAADPESERLKMDREARSGGAHVLPFSLHSSSNVADEPASPESDDANAPFLGEQDDESDDEEEPRSFQSSRARVRPSKALI